MSEVKQDYKELLIGCGSEWSKRVYDPNFMSDEFQNLTTLDINPDHAPDVVFDLNLCGEVVQHLPFENEAFDEIHAYEVLEHLGSQGDYEFFFNEFEEYYRVLKPGGYFCATVPSPGSQWAWGDPSHTRIFHPNWLGFLDQDNYEQVGQTPMSDFRGIYKANFTVVAAGVSENRETFYFMLQKKERREW